MGTEGIYKGKHLPIPVQRMCEMAERMLPNREWFLDMTYFDDGDYNAQLVSSRGDGIRDVFSFPAIWTGIESEKQDHIEYSVQYIISTNHTMIVSSHAITVTLEDLPLAHPIVLEPDPDRVKHAREQYPSM